jgi:hypothetical protein
VANLAAAVLVLTDQERNGWARIGAQPFLYPSWHHALRPPPSGHGLSASTGHERCGLNRPLI